MTDVGQDLHLVPHILWVVWLWAQFSTLTVNIAWTMPLADVTVPVSPARIGVPEYINSLTEVLSIHRLHLTVLVVGLGDKLEPFPVPPLLLVINRFQEKKDLSSAS